MFTYHPALKGTPPPGRRGTEIVLLITLLYMLR